MDLEVEVQDYSRLLRPDEEILVRYEPLVLIVPNGPSADYFEAHPREVMSSWKAVALDFDLDDTETG